MNNVMAFVGNVLRPTPLGWNEARIMLLGFIIVVHSSYVSSLLTSYVLAIRALLYRPMFYAPKFCVIFVLVLT